MARRHRKSELKTLGKQKAKIGFLPDPTQETLQTLHSMIFPNSHEGEDSLLPPESGAKREEEGGQHHNRCNSLKYTYAARENSWTEDKMISSHPCLCKHVLKLLHRPHKKEGTAMLIICLGPIIV